MEETNEGMIGISQLLERDGIKPVKDEEVKTKVEKPKAKKAKTKK